MGFISGLAGANNDFRATEAGISGPSLSEFDFNNTAANGVDQMQGSLGSALSDASMGNGPSMAQDQLLQGLNRAQNQTEAAISGTKGINRALASKMSNEAGANLSSQAISDAAAIKAQEQIAARGQLASALQTQRGQDIQQQQVINQAAGERANALNQANQITVNNKLGAAQINAGVASQNAKQAGSMASGVMGGAAAFMGSAGGKAHGGTIENTAPKPSANIDLPGTEDIGRSNESSMKSGYDTIQKLRAQFAAEKKPLLDTGSESTSVADIGETAPVDAAVSSEPIDALGAGAAGEGAAALGAGEGAAALAGGTAAAGGATLAAELAPLAALAAKGGKVGGKALVPGDSPKNDLVPTMLSPGEVVIPRSKAQDPELAKEFIEALQSRHRKKSDNIGFGKVLEAQQNLHHRISQLEKLACGGYAGR